MDWANEHARASFKVCASSEFSLAMHLAPPGPSKRPPFSNPAPIVVLFSPLHQRLAPGTHQPPTTAARQSSDTLRPAVLLPSTLLGPWPLLGPLRASLDEEVVSSHQSGPSSQQLIRHSSHHLFRCLLPVIVMAFELLGLWCCAEQRPSAKHHRQEKLDAR